MATGIEMLLKSFGLDPNEIKANVERMIGDIKGGIAALNTRQQETNVRLARIEQALNIETPVAVAQIEAKPNGHAKTD